MGAPQGGLYRPHIDPLPLYELDRSLKYEGAHLVITHMKVTWITESGSRRIPCIVWVPKREHGLLPVLHPLQERFESVLRQA